MAVLCGEHLMEKRTHTESGYRAWRTLWAHQPLTGFAHGAAGVAYALLRLGEATGDTRFLEGAEEAIAYETAVYSATARNWPDFRNVSGNRLARLATAPPASVLHDWAAYRRSIHQPFARISRTRWKQHSRLRRTMWTTFAAAIWAGGSF